MNKIFKTSRGTQYLKSPEAALLGYTTYEQGSIAPFLDEFDQELGFEDYLQEEAVTFGTLYPEKIVKVAGQLCYMSFGPKRTKDDRAQEYLDHIKSSGHGSVMEHVNYSLLIWGIDRAVTHELVRHRAGFAYSQVSQRYVSGKTLRFVERPEYQNDGALHDCFEQWIDAAAAEYKNRCDILLTRQKGGAYAGESKTDARKRVQQAARSCLPNETEAPIVVTGNARAWRHLLEMRCSPFADITIRNMAFKVYEILNAISPMLFSDYSIIEIPDGTKALETQYRKV